MAQTQPGAETIIEEVFEDLGTFDPHSEDGDDDESVFEETEIDGLPDPEEGEHLLGDLSGEDA